MTTPAFSGAAKDAGDEAAWLNAHFDACAPEYRAMLEWAGISPGDRVVDLGCGNGAFLPWLVELSGDEGRIIAIDHSLENLGRARTTINSLNAAAALAADAGRLPLADRCVDVIWCANTFEYLSAVEQERYLHEMARVLRLGGLIAVKDSEFAHKIFYPADVRFWYRFLDHLAGESTGPFVGRSLPGAFVRAGLEPRVRTFLTERKAPLCDVDRRWIGISGRAIAADAARLMGPESAEHAMRFARLFEEGSTSCILDRDDFYYCEASIMVVARTSH